MKNISPSKFLEDFGKQHRTPKSAANDEMDRNRPASHAWQPYFVSPQRGFYSQQTMSRLRHVESIYNSIRNRGEGDFKLSCHSV